MVEPAGFRGSLAVVAVFALGVVLGAALAVAIGQAIGPSATPPLRVGPAAMERLARELDLDPEQREKVRAILERNRQKVRDLFEQTREEIRGILRAEQQEAFDRIHPPRTRLRRARPRS